MIRNAFSFNGSPIVLHCEILLTSLRRKRYDNVEVIRMGDTLTQISNVGILPVLMIEELADAIPLAAALRKGGVNAIEVTVRNTVAFSAMEAIHAQYPDMAVGAGTILSPSMVDDALAAGAKFIVTPGFDQEVVTYCIKKGVPVVPGCVTPSEINAAVKLGVKTLKFFPAEQNGGVAAIKLLTGPFPGVTFIPTGGIDDTNLEAYLRCDSVAACGGSYMAKADIIRAGNWDEITAKCQKAVACSLGFELAHVGLNHGSEADAVHNAEAMNALFGLGVKNGNSSLFCGKAVEFMKTKFHGQNGHIGFYTNSVPRAQAYFKANGIPVMEDSLRLDAHGKMVSFYLEKEVGGFAVHVVRR